jgi:lipoprotein-releasing system permease protein
MLLTFAKKYIYTKQQTKAINIIAWVSIGAMAIGTAALLVVLSGFNGIDNFIRGLYSDFYTDVKIKQENSQVFEPTQALYQLIKLDTNVISIANTLEENVLLSAGSIQNIVQLKGVDKNYINITRFNSRVQYGDTNIFTPEPRILVGLGIANTMQISEQSITPISIMAFSKDSNTTTLNTESYTEAPFYVSGIFALQEEIDGKYCISSLAKAQEVLAVPGMVNAIELKLKNDKTAAAFCKKNEVALAKLGLLAQTKYEQNKTLYYILKSEKWFTYAIMSFMLLIASFNLIGSLSMLVIEKKKDISILRAMGTKAQTIKNIFLSTGVFIGMLGAVIGIVIALVLCWIQSTFKIIKFGSGGSFLIDHYPIKIIWTDFLLVAITVFVISVVASWWPSRKAI